MTGSRDVRGRRLFSDRRGLRSLQFYVRFAVAVTLSVNACTRRVDKNFFLFGFPQVVEKTVDNSQGDVNIFFSLPPGRRKGLGHRGFFSTAANFVFFRPSVEKKLFSHFAVWKSVTFCRIFCSFPHPVESGLH